MKLSQSCSPDHLFLTLIESVNAIRLSGSIHNDLKPNNIMVEERGIHYNAVVIDLGKACPLHNGKFYKLSNKVEKQKYLERYPHLAPELVAGDSPQSESTDIYSLGHTKKQSFK